MIIKNTFLITSLAFLLVAACTSKKSESGQPQLDNSTTVIISDSSLSLMDVSLVSPEKKIVESNIYLAGKVMAMPNFSSLC